MQKNIRFVGTKNKPRFLEAFGVSKKSKFILHELGVRSLTNKPFRKTQLRKIGMVNKKHRFFRMRDGPPAETGPPKTGPPMEWLVLKQTRARE